MDKSTGHIAFFGPEHSRQELFVRNGQVLKAAIGNAMDSAGYRAGRWECSVSHMITYARYFSEVYGIPLETIHGLK